MHGDLLGDLGSLTAALRRRFDQAMAGQGASLARTKLLLLIRAGTGNLRAIDIADHFGLAPRTVTEGLDGLEREGLIRRIPDITDRRVKRLEITPAGEAAVTLTEPLRERLTVEVFGVLDEAERDAFHATLRKLIARLPPDHPA